LYRDGSDRRRISDTAVVVGGLRIIVEARVKLTK